MSDYYPFKTVLFPDDNGKNYSVDIASSKWISYSEIHKSKMCQFPCGPFSQEDITKLHKMVKTNQPADKSWPVHRVIIIGRARTYPDALKSLKKVEYEPYAFSTDTESSVERKKQEENNPRATGDGNKKDIEDEFDDAIFDLISEPTSSQKIRQLRKALPKGLPQSRSKLPSSDKSSPKDSENEREGSSTETHKDDDFPPLNVSTDGLERSLENIELDESVKSQTSKSTRQCTVNKSKPIFSKESTTQSKSSPSSSESPPLKIRRDKSLTVPAGDDSPVIRTPEKDRMSVDHHSSPEVDSPHVSSDDSSNGRSPRSQKAGIRLTPRRVNSWKKTLESCSFQKTKKRKRHSLSADNSRDYEREHDRRYSRSVERDSPRKSQESPNRSPTRDEPESLIAVVNELRSYVKTIHNSLSSRIDRLRSGQLETNGHIQELKNTIEQKPQQQEFDYLNHDDLSHGDITLPVKSRREFDLFDAALKEKDYLTRVARHVRLMIGNQKNITSSSLGNIIRVFVVKTVIHEEFTALRGSKTKDGFADTNFCKILRVVHRRVLGNEIDDQVFKEKLKAVFNNAGDWEGGRLERARNSL